MSATDSPPPAAPAPDSGPRVTGDEARDLGRMRRTTKASPEGRYLGGVAGGLARHFDIDPVVVRVALVVLVFFGGSGLLLYAAGWLFVPEEGSERAPVTLDDRNRSLALYVSAGLAALALLGDTVGRFDFPWPLAVIALVVLVVVSRSDRLRPAQRGATGPVPPYDPTEAAYAPHAPVAADAADASYAVDAPEDTGTGPVDAPPVWAPPAPPAYVPPANPRRRGPILFWFTLALIALAVTTLGIVDAAGASIPDPAYPALAVGITGAMLVLGAFWGRAGGLIVVGLLSTLALVGSVGAQEYGGDGDHVHAVPTVAADLHDSYKMGAGDLKVDLTQVADPAALDTRHLELKGGVGTIQVTVPDDVNVAFTGVVHGPGQIDFFDDGRGGIDTSVEQTHVVAPDAPTLTIDAMLGVGEISVRSE
jgi:phage shock protein PspC (stress-responsive transcriptional regulator)